MFTDTYLTIKDIRCHARHGVLPQEQQVGNLYAVDLTLHYDARHAMQTDRAGDALDYAGAIDTVKRQMAVPSALLEHVAARILQALFKRFGMLTRATVTVTKLHPPVPGSTAPASFTATMQRRH